MMQELCALPIKTLWFHLDTRQLPTSDAKVMLACCLFNAIHSETLPMSLLISNPTHPMQTTVDYIHIRISMSSQVTQPSTTPKPVGWHSKSREFYACSGMAMLQFLSQT